MFQCLIIPNIHPGQVCSNVCVYITVECLHVTLIMVTTLNIRPCSHTHHIHLEIDAEQLLVCNAVWQKSVESHPSVILLYAQPVEDLILVFYVYASSCTTIVCTVDCKCICRQLFVQVRITSIIACTRLRSCMKRVRVRKCIYPQFPECVPMYLVFRGYLMQLVNTMQFTSSPFTL